MLNVLVEQYSFDSFLNYGEDKRNLDAEIKADIIKAINQSISSSMFNRSEGSGIELLENEDIGYEAFIVLSYQIALNIANYNNAVESDRQVLFSQEFVEISKGAGSGELYVNVRYLPLKNLSDVNSELNSVSLPIVR